MQEVAKALNGEWFCTEKQHLSWKQTLRVRTMAKDAPDGLAFSQVSVLSSCLRHETAVTRNSVYNLSISRRMPPASDGLHFMHTGTGRLVQGCGTGEHLWLCNREYRSQCTWIGLSRRCSMHQLFGSLHRLGQGCHLHGMAEDAACIGWHVLVR